jgi:hypothetical protein
VARVVETDAAPVQLRAAAAVLGLESLALLVTGGILVAKTFGSHPDSVGRALLGAALALGAAAALGLGARGIVRQRPAARAPIVVLQLLALPVGYSLAFQAGLVGYGAPILLGALTVLYLLFTPPARAALDRDAG